MNKKSSNLQLKNLIYYVLLLIATPFLLLQNYLQSFIGKLSRLTFSVSDFEIPYVVVIAVIVFGFALVSYRKKLNRIRIIGIFITFLLIYIGQELTDYYFNHDFYELQYNWHYFAYGIFAFIAYRFYKSRNLPDEKIILFTFLLAIAISTFDEFIQVFISNRIFDIGDIGKDAWGSIIGLFIIYFIVEEGRIFQSNLTFRVRKISDYLQNPKALFLLETIFTLILITVASLLTEIQYIFIAILIVIGLFIIYFIVFHFSQKKIMRKVFLGLFIVIMMIQVFAFFKYRKKNIINN
ncbi:MAG: VanZ family protein, partial [Candidatus Cloacimonadota bacterium]|nr:VanZ family protein [Candidatus Cloacimonadota bacterium]